MFPKKSKPATRGKKLRKGSKLLAGFCLLTAACNPVDPSDSDPALHIRVAPLHDYAWLDRHDSGQPVDMKPTVEREALLRSLSQNPADLLILRGIGSQAALHHLRDALAESGETYTAVYLPSDSPYHGLGFLYRNLDLTSPPELAPSPYTIDDRSYLPMFGSVHIQSSDTRNLTVFNARMPDVDKPYEQRRNEARILAQTLRSLLKENARVLLSLHSREEPNSPMMRMIMDTGLIPLKPVDAHGDHWTHRDPDGILYRQDQWLFVSESLHTALENQGQILDSDDLKTAGPYRHQLLRLNRF